MTENNNQTSAFQRNWITLEHNDNKHEEQETIGEFTVMQYNVLAQTLINRRTKFNYCTKKSCRWNYRRQNLLAEIKFRDASVMCLQEVDFYEDYWVETLSKIGYGHVYMKPKKMVSDGEGDVSQYGNVIAFKESEFEMIEYEMVEYQEEVNEESNNQFEHKMGLFERLELKWIANCGQVVCLRHREHGYMVIVANTHVSWRPDFKYTRLRQIHVLLTRINQLRDRLSEQYGQSPPVIFAGDLNDVPHNPLYTYLTCPTRKVVSRDPILRSEALHVYKMIKYPIPECIVERFNETILNECSSRSKYEHELIVEERETRLRHVESILNKTISQNLPLFHSAYGSYMKHVEGDTISYLESTTRYGVVTGGEYEPSHTNYVQGFQETLDYIFVEQPNEQQAVHLVPRKILALPEESLLKSETALPNETLSSDHISIMTSLAVIRPTRT